MLTALITGCNSSSDSSNDSSNNSSSSAPTVIATSPADGDKTAPLNHKVIATFSEAMDDTTVDRTSFIVKAGDEQALSGTISVDEASHSASFTPADPGFSANTVYTVTLTTAIKSKADGSSLLANNYVWTFTSGTATDIDTDVPNVTSTTPVDTDPAVAPNRAVTANFSEALDPATVNASTFTLTPAVAGVVSYSDKVAIFTPSSNLSDHTSYTATLTTGITDLADFALATTNTWSFKTGSTVAKGPEPVNLRTAGDFAILTESGITDTDAHLSKITGNIGSSPITAAAMNTVFCKELLGSSIYGVDAEYVGSGDQVCYKGESADKTFVDIAVGDMGTAYTDAAGRTKTDANMNLGEGEIGGKTIAAGLYKWGTDVNISTDVTLSGGANDVWIFQVAGNLTQASAKIVNLAGEAQAKNVFWQVGGKVTLGTDAQFNGVVLAKTLIAVKTNAIVNGRLLSQTAVTLDQNTVTQPE